MLVVQVSYAAGTPERAELEDALAKWASTTTDVPIVIGGEEIRDASLKKKTAPQVFLLLLCFCLHARV